MRLVPLLPVLMLSVYNSVYAQSVENAVEFTLSSMSGKFKTPEDDSALFHCQSALDAAIQNATLLREEMARMVDEFNVELDTLESDLKKKTKQVQSVEDRARETRRKLMDAENELKYMHDRALNTYVNFTLMQEDVVNSARKRVTGTWWFVENCYRRRLSPRIRRAKQLYQVEMRRMQPRITSLKRKLGSLTKTMENHWAKDNLLRPLVQLTTKAFSEKVYTRVEPSIKVAKEAAYLSTVSTIEEVSRAGINYLDELAEKQKTKARREQENQLERRRRATRNRHERRKARKQMNDDDFDFVPSRLQREVKAALEHSLRHSERIANRGCDLLPLILSALVARVFLLASMLLVLGLPTPLIWFICFVNLVRIFKQWLSPVE